MAVEPLLSLVVPIGFLVAAIAIRQTRLVLASLCLPFFIELSISYSVWPPHATPLRVIEFLLAIVDSLGIRIDYHRQPVFWAVFHMLDCVLLSLVAVLLAWLFAGWMKKLLSERGLLSRIFWTGGACLAGLWLYYLPWVLNNIVYGGGSGATSHPEWFWDSRYIPWFMYFCPNWFHGVSDLVVLLVMPVMYLVGVLFILRAWRKQLRM